MSNGSADFSKRLSIKQVRDPQNTLDLRVGIIAPANGNADRWLVFSNGRTEWIEKYLHVPADLGIAASTGFMTWDHRGQGASGGARAWIDHYETYGRDAGCVVKSLCQ